MCVNRFMLSVRIQVNNRLLVAKLGGAGIQKLHMIFSCVRVSALDP